MEASTRLWLNYLLKIIYFTVFFTSSTVRGYSSEKKKKKNLRKSFGFHGSENVKAFSSFYDQKKNILEFDETIRARQINRNNSKYEVANNNIHNTREQ